MTEFFWFKLLAVAVVAVLLVVSASADTIQLVGVGGNNQGGVYTVPYYLTVNHGPVLTVMCDDYTHDVVIGETWQGHVFSYADLSNPIFLTETRAGAPVGSG